MKSINHWFKPDDFIRLMQDVKDRRVTLCQFLAYTDGNVTKIFKNKLHGKLATHARGKNTKSPNMTITLLDCDNGKTIAEVFEQGPEAVAHRYRNHPDVWSVFIEWLDINK
jgi:inosine/xanthosine triphosphate pyrophosphatase family protein